MPLPFRLDISPTPALATAHLGPRFTPSPEEALTEKGARLGSLFYRGRFYDGVGTRRRGVTSLSHPKPKLKFTLPRRVRV